MFPNLPFAALGLVFAMDALAADPCAGQDVAACEATQRARCNQAIDMAVDKARSLPVRNRTEEERKRELVDRIESTVSDHRRRGEDPCRTWSAVMGIAFTQ